MSNYVNESLLDPSPMRKQRDESAKLVTKWEKSGLLEGMENEWQRSGMAVLLENQARQLISENSKTSPNAGAGVGDEEWSGVALPLVRRVFGNIVAQELVSVQPMNLPSGLVFYLDFKYGTTMGGQTSGESMAGKTGPNSPSGSSAPYGEGGFYGVGKYGYSDGSQSLAVIEFGNDPTVSSASFKDVDFDSELSASSLGAQQLWKITGSIAGLERADLAAVRAWKLTTSSTIHSILPQFNKVIDGNKLQIIVSGSSEAIVDGLSLIHI